MQGKLILYLIALIVIYMSTYVRAQPEYPYYRHRVTTFPPFDRMDNIKKLNLKEKLKKQDIEVNSRKDPDSLFFGMGLFYMTSIEPEQIRALTCFGILKGFFPVWSAILVGLTGFCFFIMLIGVLCHLAGCLSPKRKHNKKNKQLLNPYYNTGDHSIYMHPPVYQAFLDPSPPTVPVTSNTVFQTLLPDLNLATKTEQYGDETTARMIETNFDRQSSRIYNESRRTASEFSFDKKLYQHANKKRFMKNNL